MHGWSRIGKRELTPDSRLPTRSDDVWTVTDVYVDVDIEVGGFDT